MSLPAPGGPGRSPLRVAGVALVGLALVLAVVGALSGGTGDTPASTSSGGPSGTTPTTVPTTAPTTTPSATTSPPPTTPAPASTTVPRSTAASDPRATVGVVVLNNSTVRGLAARAAADVRGRGWTVAEVGNYRGLIPTTTVYYRPGTPEEAAARALAADTGARVEPRFAGLSSTAAGVVIVVASDYPG